MSRDSSQCPSKPCQGSRAASLGTHGTQSGSPLEMAPPFVLGTPAPALPRTKEPFRGWETDWCRDQIESCSLFPARWECSRSARDELLQRRRLCGVCRAEAALGWEQSGIARFPRSHWLLWSQVLPWLCGSHRHGGRDGCSGSLWDGMGTSTALPGYCSGTQPACLGERGAHSHGQQSGMELGATIHTGEGFHCHPSCPKPWLCTRDLGRGIIIALQLDPS